MVVTGADDEYTVCERGRQDGKLLDNGPAPTDHVADRRIVEVVGNKLFQSDLRLLSSILEERGIETGDPSTADQLLPLVYEEIHRLAAATLARDKPGQTTGDGTTTLPSRHMF